MRAGEPDLERAASALASRLPEPLGVLSRLAYNFRWSWTPDGPELFRSVDPERWTRCGENAVRLLQEAEPAALERAAADPGFLARAEAVEALVREDLARPASQEAGPGVTPERPVAFFCAEYGVHASLPIYSGGLGALAGDILKEASDRALPLVAVGLLYRQGYFRQRIDGWGWQHEYWVDTDPERQPAALVTGEDGAPVTVTVPIGDLQVTAQVWRVDVGRVPLFLLDADRPENGAVAKWVTSRLYVPDTDLRLAQYVLLGVGGVQALRAMDIDPGVVHLNEGHAAFASLALAQAEGGANGTPDAALDAARRRTVFTTHTPVPAGNDSYPAQQVAETIAGLASVLQVEPETVVRLGRTTPEAVAEPFGVTQFALRTSRSANGVSRRHGEVAREMWQAVWPGRELADVPITHVTNGVHIPTWLGTPMRGLLDRHLGEGWAQRATDPATWEPVDGIPDDELWAARNEQRAALVEFVRDRSTADRLQRGEGRDYVEAAARAFDERVLTIGFARRIATYKRLDLLIRDAERAVRLLGGDRPIQVVLAGKAHPRDDAGKGLVQALFSRRELDPRLGERIVFLHDYDMGVAARLVRGCDVWVNVPRPPMEASGTSGMKSAVNGGLQLSVLDGWWPEGYEDAPANGWALSGETDPDHAAQDYRHAAELYRVLEEEVIPTFHGGQDGGPPAAWMAMVRASIRSIAPRFTAARMLDDYVARMYRPG